MNQINIEEKKTVYDVDYRYHSDLKDRDYDAKITGVEEENGKISIESDNYCRTFEFHNSDPDRVIAIAQMMLAFAQMAKLKNKNKKDVDIAQPE